MFPNDLSDLARAVLRACGEAGLYLAVAESCTGGLVAACLTAVPGSSRVVERGFVTYSNQAKTELLGVPANLIATCGAVSGDVAEAMARGALDHSRADIAVAVTGIAGPDGAVPGKPVGTVFLAVARRGRGVRHEGHHFAGDRNAVRLAAARRGLEMVLAAV